MNVISPTFVRGPGKAPGSFALESAIDELAYKLKIDPVEFRIKNEPTKDPGNGRPFSSRATLECLKRGAEMIGWKNRKIEPRQMQRRIPRRLRRCDGLVSGKADADFGDRKTQREGKRCRRHDRTCSQRSRYGNSPDPRPDRIRNT